MNEMRRGKRIAIHPTSETRPLGRARNSCATSVGPNGSHAVGRSNPETRQRRAQRDSEITAEGRPGPNCMSRIRGRAGEFSEFSHPGQEPSSRPSSLGLNGSGAHAGDIRFGCVAIPPTAPGQKVHSRQPWGTPTSAAPLTHSHQSPEPGGIASLSARLPPGIRADRPESGL